MPESLEQWLWLIISVLFIGFVFVVILVIFPSPITWLCLGLFTVISALYPIVRNLPTIIRRQKSCRAQGRGKGRLDLQGPITKQLQQLELGSKKQQVMPEVTKPSLEAADVKNYVPPGLPPDLFL
jgi:hypothetical protein